MTREEAIKWLKEMLNKYVTSDPYYVSIDTAIEALEQESCNLPQLDATYEDAVSREAAIDAAENAFVRGLLASPDIRKLPSAQPERKKGKWIPQDHNKSNGMVSTLVFYYPKCSECGHSGNYTNFCPRCGADMRGDDDE